MPLAQSRDSFTVFYHPVLVKVLDAWPPKQQSSNKVLLNETTCRSPEDPVGHDVPAKLLVRRTPCYVIVIRCAIYHLDPRFMRIKPSTLKIRELKLSTRACRLHLELTLHVLSESVQSRTMRA